MRIPATPTDDPIRYRRLYPVDRIRKVEMDNDGTVVMELDCLDDGPQESIPGFENQPTAAVIGMTHENAAKLVALVQRCLADD
jgi:hypothetical protein